MDHGRSSATFYVLAYDIHNDRRRAKIAKLCEAVSERVQGSVFEGYFSPPELEKLLKKVARVMNDQEDSLRIYALCAPCRGRVKVRGKGSPTPPPGVQVIV